MTSTKNRVLASVTAAALVALSGLSFSQSETNEIEWFEAGNCWVASQGYLYCGQKHPLSQDDSGPFLSFVCFDDYHAVLLSHDSIDANSTVRSINFSFGDTQFTDSWMAADTKESFLSNRVDPSNRGFHNLLQALLNATADELHFEIGPSAISGQIKLSGLEWQAVQIFYDLCQS